MSDAESDHASDDSDDSAASDEAGEYLAARDRLTACENEPLARMQLESLKGNTDAMLLIKEMAGSTTACTNLAAALEQGRGDKFVLNALARRSADAAASAERDAVRASVETRLGELWGNGAHWYK